MARSLAVEMIINLWRQIKKTHGLQVVEQEGMDWINLSQDKDKW